MEMSRFIAIPLFALCVFIGSCSQILLKKAANKGYGGRKIFLNPYTAIAYFIMFAITLAIGLLYGTLGMSEGPLIESLTYVFVPTLSFVFFRERLPKKAFIGIGFIIAGIVVFALWG